MDGWIDGWMFNDRSVCHWLKGIHVCELYLCTVGVSSGAFWTAQVKLHCMTTTPFNHSLHVCFL